MRSSMMAMRLKICEPRRLSSESRDWGADAALGSAEGNIGEVDRCVGAEAATGAERGGIGGGA
jgi:hypothetical protein